MNAARDALVARVHRFIDTSLQGRPSEDFSALALAIHAWQQEHDPVIASLVEGPVDTFDQIPAVPVDLFKRLPVGTVKLDPAPVTFRTSGTTGGGRGVHRLRDAALYDHGSVAWARRCVPHMPEEVVALLGDPAHAPDSSLSHMVALFATPARTSWHVHDGHLNHETLRTRLQGLHTPVFLAATAFALAEWIQTAPPPLPAGSIVMVTGGFKGRTVALSDDDLYAATQARLAPRLLVTEYGMTELCSQLWGWPGQAYRPPPWMRVVAVDPALGTPVARGVSGQLRFFDLCNVDSSVGIETLDLGEVLGDGSVLLHGRLTDADARGCSLTVEEAWSLRGTTP